MIIYAEEVLTLLDLKLMFYYDLLSFLSGLASGMEVWYGTTRL